MVASHARWGRKSAANRRPSVEAAAASLLALGSSDAVAEDDRGGKDHDRDDKCHDDDVDGPGRKARDEPDEEHDDGHEQGGVADALADRDPVTDAPPLDDD